MRLRLFVKYNLAWLLLSATVLAAPNYSRGVSHSLALSIGGGEANNLLYKSDISPKAGGAGNIMFAYELQKQRFIFGLGAQLQYQYTQDQSKSFIDEFDRVDKTGESVSYGYVYNHLSTKAHDLRITLPVYIGYADPSGFYALLGAKLSYSLMARGQTQADMYTQGVYAWSIEPLRSIGLNDLSSLGYYPEAQYTNKSSYTEKLWAAASLELGSFIPLSEDNKNKKVRMRVGVYADYAIRIGNMGTLAVVDYSKINTNPQTQSQADLQQNLVINHILNSDRIGSICHNLEVGIRLTWLLNVNMDRTSCHCVRN